ncbi:unnamed protein product [Clonostachys byssicola]|uniref:Ankyrin repeat protein n=1 Tax=Clonostachys byssicola TaxID=160290 RepID=A0A9N9UQ20_9HYPO|nr:unnamed protein product [Clonostachys byssicola]
MSPSEALGFKHLRHSFEKRLIRLIHAIDGEDVLQPDEEGRGTILTFDVTGNIIFHKGTTLKLSFKSGQAKLPVSWAVIGFSDHRLHGSLSLPATNPFDKGSLGGDARLPQPLISVQGLQDGQSELVLTIEDPEATSRFPSSLCPHCILRITVTLSEWPNEVDFEVSNNPYMKNGVKLSIPISKNYLPENEINLLLWAAAVGDTKLLKTLLRLTKRSVEDITDEAGRSILVCASFMGRDEVIKFLEGLPELDWNRTDKNERSALSWAIGNGHISTTQLLLTKADANLADEDGLTPLSWAAKNGHVKTAALLYSLKNFQMPDLRAEGKDGLTPLNRAAVGGHSEVIKELLSKIPDNNENKGLLNNDIKKSLDLAAQHEHQEAIEILVGAWVFQFDDEQQRLDEALFEAATKGWLKLTECLIRNGADIDHSSAGKTPLGIAAEEGHTDVIQYLLSRGANLEYATDRQETAKGVVTGGDTPIFLAIRKGCGEAVKVLLDAGADTERSNAAGETPLHLAERHPLILSMLLQKGDDGKLATSTRDLHSETDQLFNATIVEFNSGHKISTRLEEISIYKLLSEERYTTLLEDSHSTSFQWYHLPANNVLIHKLYKNSLPSSYRILKPDRWAKRQHHGPTGSPHARFMQPLCDLVPKEVDTKLLHIGYKNLTLYTTANVAPVQGQINADQDVVLFMPFLHWDEKDAYDERNSVIENRGKNMNGKWTKEQKLLHHYVYEGRNHPLHLMHTRRTLDQFYYHSLKSTEKRDGDQAVSRYQDANFPNDPKIMAVADQLWLWVLVGPSKRAQAVISCFPSRQTSELRTNMPLDPNGKTDILHKIKLYLLQEPQAVKNPYDLVGVITSKCSGAFLDPSNPPRGLQFSEVYESSISNIMNEEAELFDDFNVTSRFRSKYATADREILENLEERLGKALLARRLTDALDITQEIGLLRQIKDIQDELNIISMVFENQRIVVEKMERISRSMQAPTLEPASQVSGNANDLASTDPNEQTHETKGLRKDSDSGPNDAPEHTNARFNPNLMKTEGGAQKGHVQRPSTQSTINIIRNEGIVNIAHNNDMSTTQPVDRDIYNGDIWGASHSPPNSSFPLRVVLQCAEDVEMMIQRTERAYKALNFLVDLKQKQNNVEEARATRIQAQASFKMTVESEKQGKTLMLFTVATIVFLPLSFMAAFFAINITEFERNEKGTLGLSYVSKIMCP